MTRKRAAIVALPAAALPELQELLGRFCGPEDRRGNVVMMRLGDEALGRLDEMIEAGLFGSRSEAAAFLLGAGIEAQKELFAEVTRHSAEIRRIRQTLRQAAVKALRGSARRSARRKSRPPGPRGGQ